MAYKVIISELLCFLKSHFGNIPLASILTVIASYYSEDEICKAKLILHELCIKYLGENNVPHLIIRKGENKRKTDLEDVGNFLKLLDEHKIELPLFVALNSRRAPHKDPANVDLRFLLESVEELRRSVSSLMDVEKSSMDCKLPSLHYHAHLFHLLLYFLKVLLKDQL